MQDTGVTGGRVYSLEEIAERVRPVAEEYGVESMRVFGSYSRGSARSDSDVDLWVSVNGIRGIRIGGLYLALRDALGKDVDLVTDDCDPRFMDMIRRDAVIVYGRDGARGPSRRSALLHARHAGSPGRAGASSPMTATPPHGHPAIGHWIRCGPHPSHLLRVDTGRRTRPRTGSVAAHTRRRSDRMP